MGYAERGQAPHILAGLPPSSERSTLACKGWRGFKDRMDQAEVKPSLWTRGSGLGRKDTATSPQRSQSWDRRGWAFCWGDRDRPGLVPDPWCRRSADQLGEVGGTEVDLGLAMKDHLGGLCL